eukprot:6634734-Prymnesium_polylepis.1
MSAWQTIPAQVGSNVGVRSARTDVCFCSPKLPCASRSSRNPTVAIIAKPSRRASIVHAETRCVSRCHPRV